MRTLRILLRGWRRHPARAPQLRRWVPIEEAAPEADEAVEVRAFAARESRPSGQRHGAYAGR